VSWARASREPANRVFQVGRACQANPEFLACQGFPAFQEFPACQASLDFPGFQECRVFRGIPGFRAFPEFLVCQVNPVFPGFPGYPVRAFRALRVLRVSASAPSQNLPISMQTQQPRREDFCSRLTSRVDWVSLLSPHNHAVSRR
jgi:hypothetical protein